MNEQYSSRYEILYKGKDFNESEIPAKVQSFSMSLVYPDYDAWLHYYEKEELCKAYTEGLSPYIEHIKKFPGSLTLDRSIGRCDSIDIQKYANNLNKHCQEIFQKNGIPYIINVRFGDKKSYPFCFHDISQNSILFIGNHGTQRFADYKAVQFAGTCELIKRKHPRILLVYGSVDKRILKECTEQRISLLRYPSQCELAHAKKLPLISIKDGSNSEATSYISMCY